MQPVRDLPLLINGKLVSSTSTEWQDVINPSTQEVVARVPFATPDEVNAAVASAQEAFSEWRNASQSARIRVMFKLQQLIRENTTELAELITREHGKTLPDAEGEIGRCLDLIEYACSMTTQQLGEYAENAASGIDVYSVIQPLGVCAGITAFNFPIMLPCSMFPVAVTCGNSFILKPSEQAPSAALYLAQLALEAGLPAGVLNVVYGGADVSNALCEHPNIKAVSFIGSTRVGTLVYRRATAAGKRCQSMLGAKNHCIVLPDADKDQVIDHLLGAVFGAAGQRCMATTVAVFVGESQEWLAELVERAKDLRVGPGTDRETVLGPVINKSSLSRINTLISSGVTQGATLLLDGRNISVAAAPQGNFIGPTVFSDVTADMEIYKEEIFGPVLCAMNAETLDEAIHIVNANPNGNGVAIYTQDGGAARHFQNDIDVGQVGINIPIPVPVAWFSFTGSRASTLGDLGTGGKQAVTFWTQTKTVTARWKLKGAAATGVNSTITLK